MKIFFHLIIIILSIIAQQAFLPALSAEQFLNLPLILILLFNVFCKYYKALSLSFVTGIIYDFSTPAFGILSLSFLLISFIIKQMIIRIREANFLSISLIGVVGIISYQVSFLVFNYLFKIIGLSNYPQMINIIFGYNFWISIVVNLVFFITMSLLIKNKYKPRLLR